MTITAYIEEQLKKFEKDFGHHGEIWNGKKGSNDGLEIKSFLTNAIHGAVEIERERMILFINKHRRKYRDLWQHDIKEHAKDDFSLFDNSNYEDFIDYILDDIINSNPPENKDTTSLTRYVIKKHAKVLKRLSKE